MRHLRWIPPGAWPQAPVDPEDPEAGERDATRHELLQMDLVPLGDHPEGGWIVDCLGREGRTYPGHQVSRATGAGRWTSVSRDVLEVCLHCTVQRARDGTALRQELAVESDPGPARSPAGVGRERRLDHRLPDPPEVVRAARERDDVERRRVPVRKVRDEDVVEAGPHPGHRWAGEA